MHLQHDCIFTVKNATLDYSTLPFPLAMRASFDTSKLRCIQKTVGNKFYIILDATKMQRMSNGDESAIYLQYNFKVKLPLKYLGE
jgi:hypothetical protein